MQDFFMSLLPGYDNQATVRLNIVINAVRRLLQWSFLLYNEMNSTVASRHCDWLDVGFFGNRLIGILSGQSVVC